ncbi:MAG: hypothetical protein JSU65_02975 [Candidatus Zixiibacteriota bacterium]|nr:MAG: hypothetical protein JSU65_02975 [candidate division Zixibacteria bacterium]
MEGLDRIESNGITAYMESSLREYVSGLGRIHVDYIQQESGNSGYVVTVGAHDGCDSTDGSFCC